MNYDEVERVEAELDRFVAKRARENAEASRIEGEWAESERRHRERRRERGEEIGLEPEPEQPTRPRFLPWRRRRAWK